jgi:hypothetical protein
MPRRLLNAPCPCTACGHRREARHGARGRAAWLGLLGLLACSVPLAAALPGDEPEAGGVVATPVTMTVPREPVLVPGTVRVTGEDGGAIIDWRESEPGGSPNGGRLRNGVRLPASGAGYYTYDPRTQREPGGLATRWGTARLVREMVDLGEWWSRTRPGAGPLGIGDLSGPDGGRIDGHASHQNGLDVDIRLPRRDRARGPANPSNYDRALTQAVVDRLVARGASLILIGHSLDLRGPAGVVVRWPNHDDHLHVRFPG